MVEIGLEPQELFERVEQHKEVAEHLRVENERQREHKRSAITASILAVMAALGALLAGHAANDAILSQAKASDQWSYYQAKSTKAHLYELSKELVGVMPLSSPGSIQSTSTQNAIQRFDRKINEYSKEKDDIAKEARALEADSSLALRKHNDISVAISCFQIGIVLASVSILVQELWLYNGSILAGLLGLAFLVIGAVSK